MDEATSLFLDISSNRNDFEGLAKRLYLHKIKHSFFVLEMMERMILTDEEMKSFGSEDWTKLEIIGLLHDIGRFFEVEKSEIKKNFDHGIAGYNILKQKGIDDLEILLAVKHHNKINLDSLFDDYEFKILNEKSKKRILFFCKAIRDADKLSNMEFCMLGNMTIHKEMLVESGKSLGYKINDYPFLEFLEGELLNYANIQSFSDYILLICGWVYDLNFKASFEILKSIGFKSYAMGIFEKDPSNKEKLPIIKKSLDKYI